MHYKHIIITQADNIDEAIGQVDNYAQTVTWSDWHELGGRYTDHELTEGCALSYVSNPTKFMKLVNEMTATRNEIIQRAVRSLGSITIGDLLTSPLYDDANYSAEFIDKLTDPSAKQQYRDEIYARFRVGDALDILRGRHSCETYFYDIEAWENSPDDLMKRIETSPNQQHLVVVDFHL